MRRRIALLVVVLTATGLTVLAAPAPERQASDEEIGRALQMLGEILGVPEIRPEELKRKVEEVGGLRFTRAVPIDFMTRDELAAYIRRLFDEEYPPEAAAREERMLRAFGFLTAEEDLRVIREGVLNENIAGFYDERPEAKKLFAVSPASAEDNLDFMNQLILSHELRHALQDQHVNLRQVLGEGTDFDDRRLAALSLLEGDATLLMEKYLAAGLSTGGGQGQALAGLMGMGGGDSRAMADMFAGPQLRSAPPVVREQLLVPYLDGKSLAAAIFERGGFRLLNERLADPPRSMEQVLHPEKYLDRPDEPMVLMVSEATGESVESEGRLGEFLIRVLLQPIMPRQEAERAAAGWGGDQYALWADGQTYRLVWHTTWDSVQEAAEFHRALTQFASLRYGSGALPSGVGETVMFEGDRGERSHIRYSGRDVTLEREGLRLTE
jgi:hypothetical protein